jgi:hypothetical protein
MKLFTYMLIYEIREVVLQGRSSLNGIFKDFLKKGDSRITESNVLYVVEQK